MESQIILESVAQFGYPALFFALWLGIVGMPIPDEVIVLSAGIAASLGYLQVVPAFLVTYLGVVSGLSVGYVLGKSVGAPILERLKKKRGMTRYLDRGQALLDQYGHYALCISYFLPVVRHVVPYLVGIGKMSFRRYALFSYTTGFVWTLALYAIGYVVGDHAKEMEKLIGEMTVYLLWGSVGLAMLAGVAGYMRKGKTNQESA